MKHLRNSHKCICILLCLCMLLPLAACGETKESQRQVFAMDTVMTLTAYGNKADIGLNAAQSVIQSMDTMLDPDTDTSIAVTILCEDGTLADCLSTAMFILGETAALNYWRNYGGFEMILVNKDNQITCTKGLIEEFTLANNSYTLKFTE